MATWVTQKEPDETCPKCGKAYEVESTQYPVRDKGSFVCSCGEELRRWNGTRDYDYRVKSATKK